jgi:hemerythrin superfamily protein
MARSTQAQPLALELLSADHRKVEKLFQQYEQEKEGDDSRRQEICERICNELTVHAQVEEEIFYPWVRENGDDEDMIEEALVEHESLKTLVSQIEGAEPDESYDAKVKVLSEYVKHHVKEEENEMFAAVRGKSEELDELGQEIASRKMELMEELGMEADEGEEEEPEGKASRGSSRSSGDSRRASR